MFNLGFTELLLLAIIGLVVIGPERMPEVARQIGRWVGAAKRTTQQFQRQLETEVKLQELNKKIIEETQDIEKRFAEHQPEPSQSEADSQIASDRSETPKS